MLLARRNEGLEAILKDCLAKIKPASASTTSGKKDKSKGEKAKKGVGRWRRHAYNCAN